MAWCLIVQVFMSKLLIVEIFGQKSWAEGKSHAFFLPGHLGKYVHLITWSRPVETVALHTQQVCLTWSNPTQSPIQNNSHYVRTNTRCVGTAGEVLGMESVYSRSTSNVIIVKNKNAERWEGGGRGGRGINAQNSFCNTQYCISSFHCIRLYIIRFDIDFVS